MRYFTERDLELARLLAEHHHRNQMYDIYPYIKHIDDVVAVANRAIGTIPSDRIIIEGVDLTNDLMLILISCYLHDCIEDGHLSYNDIKLEFGIEVAEVVYAVTDELGRNRKERKGKTYPKIKKDWRARVVKLCDRIANVQNSIRTKGSTLGMYKKEFKQFMLSIRDINSETFIERVLWEMYHELLNDEK